MSFALEEMPPTAAAAWGHLRDELKLILGDDLVALWGWGSTVLPDRPAVPSDLDTHVVIERRLDEPTWAEMSSALAALAVEFGVQWDISITLRAESDRGELPRSARLAGSDRFDVMWAVNRAHWMAGSFVSLLGPPPDELVSPPTWPELQYALGRELEHLERHVIDGPHDAYEGRCAIFNGSRVLYALETQETALSKRAGGIWAMANLPEEWHQVIQLANETYDREASPDEVETLVNAMEPFVAMVRERVPQLADRTPGAPPRWSV